MKDILTLVDFTDTAEIAVDEALSIAEKTIFQCCFATLQSSATKK